MSRVVAPFGTVSITLAANDKIAIESQDTVKVYQIKTYVNYPPTREKVAEADGGGQTVTAALAAGTYELEAGAFVAYYEVGSAPVVDTRIAKRIQGTPIAKTTAVTLTIAELMQGIITGTHAAGATQAYTLPTGALSEAGAQWDANEAFDWTLINLSAAALDTITITAGAQHTLVGEGIVQSAHATTGQLYGSSGTFRTRRVSAGVFETYRLT